jgi:hypothetical protein
VSLREFLASEAANLRDERSEAMKKRDEWIASVDRLFGQIKAWLLEADTEHALTLSEGRYELAEVGIGRYEAPVLLVALGVREVSIKPVARFVAGPLSSTGSIHIIRAYGRVDMSNGLEKYMIFRTDKEPDDRWVIIEQDGYRTQPLNQESFESAFQSLLE